MRLNNVIRTIAATAAVLTLGNCTTTKGGAGAKIVTSAEYETNFNRVTGLAPTSDMPTTLNGSYAGVTKMDLREGSTVRGEVLGDLALDVAWTDGQTANPFTGTAGNFRGTIDGVENNFDGTLNVDNTFGGAILRTESTIALPGGGAQTLAVGTLSVALTGDVNFDGTPGTVILTLGGNFFGPGASAATGPAGMVFATGSGLANASGAGTFYLDKQ